MKSVVILHHHEIVLKGENRRYFERQLIKNIRAVLSNLLPSAAIRAGYGRCVIELGDFSDTAHLLDRLSRVFGVANVCLGVETAQSIPDFIAAADLLLSGHAFSTIRVHTKRSDKSFPHRSMEVNAIIGEHLCRTYNVRANLSTPDETIFVEIAERRAYVYRSKMAGAGGLPTGVSGRVVSLLSAGFDSPVASWKIMRRGASVIFVHFHSRPYTSEQSVNQVREIVRVLSRYQLRSKLHIVPFAEVQQEIVMHAPPPLRVLLYRRMMIRIAGRIATDERAEALVTGEAVGQVASQTLRNIRVIDEAAALPVLRPLSGTDKEETMAIARKIGTHDISREPYDDCCSFLAPRRPETWADLGSVSQAESAFTIDELVATALRESSVESFSFPQQHHEETATAGHS